MHSQRLAEFSTVSHRSTDVPHTLILSAPEDPCDSSMGMKGAFLARSGDVGTFRFSSPEKNRAV